MKTFKIYNCKSQYAIIGEGANQYGLHKISVGERGRGRFQADIVCHEAVQEGDIVELGQTQTGKHKLFKKTANTKFEGWIVRADASGAYTKNTQGRIEIKKGNPTALAEGHCAWGDAGNAGGYPEKLYACPFGTILYVRRASPNKGYEPFYIFVRQTGVVEVKESDVESFIDAQNIAVKTVWVVKRYGVTPIATFDTKQAAIDSGKFDPDYDSIEQSFEFV